MTLDTKVVISAKTPVDVEALYAFCAQMVGTPEGIEPRRDPSGNCGRIDNPPGIGANAWLMIEYGMDGPLVSEPYLLDGVEDEDDKAYRLKSPSSNGWGCIEVSFDTAYGYRDENGLNCTALHATYILRLGEWLDERGADWQWQNEYTGEWFSRYDGIFQFVGSDGPKAMDWFQNVAKPVIDAEIGKANG